jgi:hypothetical protein
MVAPLIGGAIALGSWAYRGYKLAKSAKAVKKGIDAVRAGGNAVKSAGQKVSQGYNRGIEKGVEKAMGTSKTVVPAPANTVIKGRPYKFINQKTGEGVNRKTAERFASVQRAKRDKYVGEVKSVVKTGAAVETGRQVYNAVSDATAPKPKQGEQADARRVDNAIDAKNNPNQSGKYNFPNTAGAGQGKRGAAKVIADAKAGDKKVAPSATKPRVMANVENAGIAKKPAAAPNRPPAELANSGGATMPSSSPSSVQVGASAEPEVSEASIMKKYNVSNLKQLGLAVSNEERKSNASSGAFASFQRFAEGNIDQEGSAAYNKYGAGYGKAIVDREIAAAKKKKAAK